jgi:predicted acylesterase/phospholipase RssA
MTSSGRSLFLSPGRWVPGGHRRKHHGVGLIISGGGSRGDFHLGALEYLYDEARIEPTIISGASAGAIIAAVIAQGGNREEQREWLGRLDTMWRAMTTPDDMFTPQTWWRDLLARGPGYLHLLDPLGMGLQPESGGRPPAPRTAAEARAATHAPPDEPGPAATWSAAQVMQMIGNLPALGRAGGDLASILKGATRAGSMYTPGPFVDSLIDRENFDPERVRAAGTTLRIAMVGLASGDLRFVDQDGTIRDRGDTPLEDENGETLKVDDVTLAVWASCAIPAVFRPVEIAGEHYVDGGVRENLPADVVIDKLGATDSWSLVCHPPGAAAKENELGLDPVSVMMRTGTSIMSDEQLRDEIVFARSRQSRIVQASVDVHDTMTVDRGLTALMADHGWIRAAQVHLGASHGDEDAADALIRARLRAWELEELLLDPDGEGPVPGAGLSGVMTGSAARGRDVRPTDPTPSLAKRLLGRSPEGRPETESAAGRRPASRTDLRGELRRLLQREPTGESRSALVDELTEAKAEIRDLLEVVPGGHVPDRAETWWQGWETHGEQVDTAPPWQLDDNTGLGGI